MNTDINNQSGDNQEYNATLYSGEDSVVKKTDVEVKGVNNPDSKKIIIEKQVNVVHKEAKSLKKCQYDLLDQIYKTSIMGMQSIEAIIKDIDSSELAGEIQAQYDCYKSIYAKAIDYMYAQGLEPERTNPVKRALRWSSIKITAMAKKTSSHIAEMMINGTTMGIIEMYRALNNCSCDPSAEPKPLALELLDLLRSSVDKLVKYL